MKNSSFALMALLVFNNLLFSQDLIVKRDGSDVESKVVEVAEKVIKYKNFSNPDGPLYSISKDKVLMIRYENGTKDVFNSAKKAAAKETPSLTDEDLQMKGLQDAKMYYDAKNTGAGWTAAATVLFSPLIGVIPAAITASSEPKDKNLDYPDPKLMEKYSYNESYKKEALKKKKRKIWAFFGVSSGAWLLLLLLL